MYPKIKKKVFFIISVIILYFSFYPSCYATQKPSFSIDVIGNKITNSTKLYGDVKLDIKINNYTSDLTLWIYENGIWRMFPKSRISSDGIYIDYTEDNKYHIKMRLENSKTKEYSIKQINFEIDNTLKNVIDAMTLLPKYTVDDEIILKQKGEIYKTYISYNKMDNNQKSIIPKELINNIEYVKQRISNLDNSYNISIPKPPIIYIKTQGRYIESVYSQGVDIVINSSEKYKYQYRVNETWNEIAKNEGEIYKVSFSDVGSYKVEIRAVDELGQVSASVFKTFAVDPDVYKIISDANQLYSNAHQMSVYIFNDQLETTYQNYIKLVPLQQHLVPDYVVENLEIFYQKAMNAMKFTYQVVDENNNFIRFIGLYNSLNLHRKYQAIYPIEMKVQRTSTKALLKNIDATMLTEYNFQINHSIPETVAMSSEHPITVCIQVPEDLKGKQKLEVLHVEDGSVAKTITPRVRSTKENLVMYFEIEKTGKYVLISKNDD